MAGLLIITAIAIAGLFFALGHFVGSASQSPANNIMDTHRRKSW
jgi:hypothetical protein